MAKVSIQPQRQRGKGKWFPCEPHQAQRWVAINSKGRIVKRCNTAREMRAWHENYMLRMEGPARQYKLGQRMGPRSELVGSILMIRNLFR